MSHEATHVMYVGAILPKRSETFVYREVLGLRARGMRVTVASVRQPERALGDPALDELANQADVVYGPKMILDATLGAAWRPKVALRGLLDSARTSDLGWKQRPRVLVQVAGALGLAWRQRNASITHVHAHMAHVPTTIAMYTAMALGVPMSFTGHAADLFRDRQMLTEKLQRASAIMCISEWHRGFYQSLLPLPPSRLPVVRCGVDLSEFTPGPGGAGILAVGRLVPKKGFDTLIRAIAILIDGNSNAAHHVRLTLVGDGPERVSLERLAAELGLSDRIVFAGPGTQSQVRASMREADLFVLPCRVSQDGDRDGIPVVLMEAMASGVPVISGDLATIRELIVDDQCGRLVPPDRPEVLATAITRLLSDPEERRRVAAAGRRRVADEFSIEATLDALIECFSPLTSQKPPRAGTIPVASASSRDA